MTPEAQAVIDEVASAIRSLQMCRFSGISDAYEAYLASTGFALSHPDDDDDDGPQLRHTTDHFPPDEGGGWGWGSP